MTVCSRSAFRSGVSMYLPGSLPPDSVTKWLPAPSQCKAMVRGKFTLLPCIDPPTALLLSALLYCIDVFSNDTHTQCVQMFCAFECTHAQRYFENCHTINIQRFCQAYIQFIGSRRHRIRPLTLLLLSSSPSWVVSYCQGQTNQPKLTSGSRKGNTGRDVFMEQGLLIDRRVHLQN